MPQIFWWQDFSYRVHGLRRHLFSFDVAHTSRVGDGLSSITDPLDVSVGRSLFTTYTSGRPINAVNLKTVWRCQRTGQDCYYPNNEISKTRLTRLTRADNLVKLYNE